MNTELIGVGILGAGRHNIATDHQLPASLKSQKVKVVALCDLNPEVHDFAATCGARAYTSYEEMLADPDVEMIQIATPDQFHCQHALMALQNKKHVFLQKPPCVNRKELNTLLLAARNSECKIKVLLNQRYSLLTRTIQKYIEDGMIGDLREIIIRYRGKRFPIEDPKSFYLTQASGGVWLHNALHWLDEAYAYSKILPDHIMIETAKNENDNWKIGGNTPNYYSAIFTMQHVTFLFEYNTMLLNPGLPSGMQRVMIGTKGEIRQEYGEIVLKLFQSGLAKPENLELPVCREDPVVESFRMAIDDFAEEISTGKKSEPSFQSSMHLFDLLLHGLGR